METRQEQRFRKMYYTIHVLIISIILIRFSGHIARLLRNRAMNRLLLDVTRILNERGIKYFLDWGTLLGAYRSSDFLYNDDDLDLGLIDEDIDGVLKVLKDNLKDYIVDKGKGAIHVKYDIYNMHLDLWNYFIDNNRLQHVKKRHYFQNPESGFVRDEKTGFKSGRIRRRIYPIPSDTYSYLKCCYDYTGADCAFVPETAGYRKRTFRETVVYLLKTLNRDFYFIAMMLPISRDRRNNIDNLKLFKIISNVFYPAVREK